MNRNGFAPIVIILIAAILLIGAILIVRTQIRTEQTQLTPVIEPSNWREPLNWSRNSTATKITDKGNLYSVEIPKDWKITGNEGARGIQLSVIAGESPDWKSRADEKSGTGPCNPIYYDSGASFQFNVFNREEAPVHYGEGGGPETGVISKKNIMIGGVSGVYHIVKEPCTYAGQLADAHINYKGNGYRFRFAYNPDKFPQAETVFANILNSVKFIK